MLYGVCLNRSIELLISIWAILKAGAIYMPMYVGYPLDRLNYMIENSSTKLIITNSAMSKILKVNGKIIINSFSDISELDNIDLPVCVDPTDTAYIIYTSGSTGRPKGVKISHKNLINFVYSFNNYYKKIDSSDVFMASTNISFDVSIWELFLPILNGAKLVLNSEELLNNIIDYCSLIINKEITALYIPPNILTETYEILKNSDNIKINKLLVGVEPIKKDTLNKYFDLNEDMIIVNGYGPTETTICSTALTYKKDLQDINNFVPIGHPLGNTHIYILNQFMQNQPIGVPGELYIGGDGVGNGYVNNDIENQKHFIKINNELFYKTGDLAKWNADGTITFIGRNDHQVKISGYRIELNEINSVIMSYPHITNVHTVVLKNNEKPYLVSYFTSEDAVVIKDLRSHLQSKLTFYMIPKFFVQLDSFPLTVNGKVDVKALPIPSFESDKPFVKPRNEFEKSLEKIWCNLLGISKLSIDDNFFDVGCDSLIAIKFQTEVLKQNLNITYGDIFNYPTIRLLSENKSNEDINTNSSYANVDDYDYSSINKILLQNKVESLDNLVNVNINGILLLGSTGFLGAHILNECFSEFPDSTIYCIIRRKSYIDPKERLLKNLNYYFGDKYNNYFDENKIVVIEGDLCQKDFGISPNALDDVMDKVDVIINSAALVKHYGNFNTFSEINIAGTKNVVDICKRYAKKLYHISTLSVSGIGLSKSEEGNSNSSSDVTFDETCLFINQNLDNMYIYTKYEAEKYILNELNNNLDATILRIGNLTNRFEDGLFQINVSENAFVNRLKSIINLGVMPESFLKHSFELTPVDLCAKAIVKILCAKHNFSVLHLFNTNLVSYKDFLGIINNCGYNVTCVPDEEIPHYINQYLSNDSLKNKISGIITDINSDRELNYTSGILLNADITNKFLNKTGFYWPILNLEYFKKYFEFFKNINYFDEEV